MKVKLWINDAFFDPRLFNRVGRSIDVLTCALRQSYCRCKPKCAICGCAPHTGFHGPIYGRPVGSVPWGHEYAAAITADELPAIMEEVDRAVMAAPEEMRDDVRQDVALSLLTHGRPADLSARVDEKVRDWFRQRNRHRMLVTRRAATRWHRRNFRR